jgi:hypothetical protein
MTDKPKTEKSESQLAQDFANEYQELCKKHGFQIQVVPAWKARDDGTFSLVQQVSVAKLPKEEDAK